MTIPEEQPDEWLGYYDYLDHEVYVLLRPWEVSQEEELTQHYCQAAPSLLAYWRLYQALKDGTQRHMYRCLNHIIEPSVGAFLNQSIGREVHVDTILNHIASGELTGLQANGIVHTHLETALIVSALDRFGFAKLYECEPRMETLRGILAQTEAAICANAEQFRINYECWGILPLLKPSGRKIPSFLPVVQALAHE